MNTKITSISNIICVVLWCACLIVPIIYTNHKSNQVSEIDNTLLIEWDSLGKGDNTFNKDLETYLTERIGFRDTMIDTYLNTNDMLFDTLLHPTYTYGENDYVFFHMPKETYSKTYLKSFAKFVSKLQTTLNERGIDFLYCINPNKTVVYSDYLPKGVNLTFPRQKTLLKYLDKSKVRYIDNTDALINASNTMEVFDKKYDAGHWNDNGAYIGFTNILKELSLNHPEIPVNTLSDYTINQVTHDKLPLSNMYINEPSVLYTRNNPSTVDITANDTDIVLHEQYHDYSHFVNPSHPELPKILVFRGSYFLGREKFMNESFSESIFVHSYYNIFNYDYYVDKFKPDIVLFESVEYATTNTYFPKDKLKAFNR